MRFKFGDGDGGDDCGDDGGDDCGDDGGDDGGDDDDDWTNDSQISLELLGSAL